MMMMMNDEMGKGTYMFTVMSVADFIGTVFKVAILTFAGFTLFIRRAEWRLKLIWSQLLLYSAL